MFLGEYEHTIDVKGRIAVPAKYRQQIKEGAVVSKGMGICLSVYPMPRWEEKSAELASNKNNEELRDIERIIREHLETLRYEWDAFCSGDTHPA